MDKPAQVIQPPNTLRLKVGSSFGTIDPIAVAKAEQALAAMSDQFAQWLQDELDKLDVAWAAVQAQGLNGETAEALYFRVHDLKGLGGTYEYPLVTRIAGSMCRLMDDPAKRLAAPVALLAAHVQAIKAVVRDKIKDDDHPVGAALAMELEAKVDAHQG